MNIQLLLTGNELMSGDIIDSNSAMIAEQLQPLGIGIGRKVTLGDDLTMLVAELQQMSRQADLLLVNGGLGPTQDDLTAQALALATDRPLVTHQAALDHLTRWCEQRGARLNAANLKQTLLPQGAEIVPNPRGSAVGFKMRLNDCEIICTPGVPGELRAMLQQTIIPAIAAEICPDEILVRERFHTFGLGEASLQQLIDDRIPDWPAALELGFRAGTPTLEVKVQGPKRLYAQHRHYVEQLQALIQDSITSTGEESQAAALVRLLAAGGKRVTTAESCTGGLIAAMITAVPGSSAVFEAGYVTYSNAQKSRMLAVSADTLQRHGAVSEATVREMAQGALRHSGADYVIAVSGIAGPDGGTDDKPVGTVWLAWGDRDVIRAACLYLPYGRNRFQTMTAGAGLDLVRRLASGIEAEPRYLRERVHPGWKGSAPPGATH